jgi:hypothetical protein
MNPSELPIYLTAAAAVAAFSVSRSSLYRMMDEGVIRTVKRGSGRLIETASLLAHFNSLHGKESDYGDTDG